MKILVRNFYLNIGKQPILKDINILIPERKITVILGPSGCGKTTLLKCFNRLIDLVPNVERRGSIFLNNRNIFDKSWDLTELRKKLGLLAQKPYPLPMSIFNNIAFGLKLNGCADRKLLNERVRYFLEQVNLWKEVKDRLHEPASKLSIGQQQRLCLARGLAVDPEIILADEPTSALDPISSMAIEERFVSLKDRYTIVLVTHILRQARRIADYVIFMYMGEVIEQGTAEEVFNNPTEKITKAYMEGTFN